MIGNSIPYKSSQLTEQNIAYITFVECACDEFKDGLGKFRDAMLTPLWTASHGL